MLVCLSVVVFKYLFVDVMRVLLFVCWLCCFFCLLWLAVSFCVTCSPLVFIIGR